MTRTTQQTARTKVEEILKTEFPAHEIITLTIEHRGKNSANVAAGLQNEKENVTVILTTFWDRSPNYLENWFIEEATYTQKPPQQEETDTPQERYRAIAEAAKTLTELTSTLQLQTIQDTNIEELAGCYSSFSPSDLFKALAAEATALAANKVWNPKEELATESTNQENILKIN